MIQPMKSCITCGMPLEGDHAGDVGMETADGLVCKFDSKDGVIKSGTEIFHGGVEYFTGAAAGRDRALAERLTRRNMKDLPYWQARHFPELDGETSDDAEFGAAMAKLQ